MDTDKDGKPVQAGETPPEPAVDLGSFKDVEALKKSYKEVQGAFTKATEENKKLREDVEVLNAVVSEIHSKSPKPNTPQEQITAMVRDAVAFEGITATIKAEQEADPEGFDDTFTYVETLSRKYPHMRNSASGVKKLFVMAKEQKDKEFKKHLGRVAKALLGRDVTFEELQKMSSGANPVPGNAAEATPDLGVLGGMAPNNGAAKGAVISKEKKEAFEKQKKEAVERGDASAVLDAMFAEMLQK